MAGLYWMAVTLTVLLSAGNSLAMNQNELATIVNQVLTKYRPSYSTQDGRVTPMFSLAVSIPYNSRTKEYDINLVPDTGDNVKNTIQNCDVYKGTRLVAATVLKWPKVWEQCPNGRVPWRDVLNRCPRGVQTWADIRDKCSDKVKNGRADHAEYRTLQEFNNLIKNQDQTDLLLFYVYASPCAQRCTNASDTRNILKLINPIQQWNNYAFVFSKVFKPKEGDPIPVEILQQALISLGTYTDSGVLRPIGLNNIFRCDRERGQMQCTSCSTNGQLTVKCYTDEQQSG